MKPTIAVAALLTIAAAIDASVRAAAGQIQARNGVLHVANHYTLAARPAGRSDRLVVRHAGGAATPRIVAFPVRELTDFTAGKPDWLDCAWGVNRVGCPR